MCLLSLQAWSVGFLERRRDEHTTRVVSLMNTVDKHSGLSKKIMIGRVVTGSDKVEIRGGEIAAHPPQLVPATHV